MHNFDQLPNFFIVGSQRSGTTLLRLMLNTHSQIGIPEEGGFLSPYLKKSLYHNIKTLRDKEKRIFLNYIKNDLQFKKWDCDIDESVLFNNDITCKQAIGSIYWSFCQKHGNCICGDKTPKFIRKLPVLTKAYPSSKFIYIVRDGRDTFLSLKNKNHHSAKSIEIAAFEWRIKNWLAVTTLKSCKERLLILRYEDLVTDPVAKLSDICKFLDVPYEENMVNFWKGSDRFIERQHSDLIFKPINKMNIYKWKKLMPANDIKAYEFFAGGALKRYGYETIAGKKFSAKEYARHWTMFCLNLPARFFRIAMVSTIARFASKYGFQVPQKYYE